MSVVQPHVSSQGLSTGCFDRVTAALEIGSEGGQLGDPGVGALILASTVVRSRSWTVAQRPPSQAVTSSAISSRLQPSCLARAMNRNRSSDVWS